jgi:hypothetical protein
MGEIEMRLIMAAAAFALLAGTPSLASAVPSKKSTAKAAPKKATLTVKKAPDFDPAQMMAIFDKIFPPQPDPLPARLALSRTSVNGLFPDGTYARMMDGMLHGLADRVLGMTEADFAAPGKSKPGDTMTLRQKMAKDDPYFEERVKIMQRVISEELAKFAAIIEPKIRDGLARSMARKFDEKQLTDINAFLATDTGKEFGRQSMAMYVDPDVMRSMMGSFPEMMKAMPAAMQRIEAETSKLPKPKKVEASDAK